MKTDLLSSLRNLKKGYLFVDNFTNLIYKITAVDAQMDQLSVDLFGRDNLYKTVKLSDFIYNFREGKYRFLELSELYQIWLQEVSPIDLMEFLEKQSRVKHPDSAPVLEITLLPSFDFSSSYKRDFVPSEAITLKTARLEWKRIKGYFINKKREESIEESFLFIKRYDDIDFTYKDFLIFLSESYPYFERPNDENIYY